MAIVSDEEILGGEPRIEGSRIGVRHVAGRVVEGGQSPASVADQLDVSLARVYEALSYYHDNIEEMRELEREHEQAYHRLREEALKPTELVE
jgi:uncharacterized protein (DUF433 family)